MDSNPGISSFPLEQPRLKVRRHRRHRRTADTTTAVQLPYFITGQENQLVSFLCCGDSNLMALSQPVLLVGPNSVGKTTLALHLAARYAVDHPQDGIPAVVHHLSAVDYARQYADAIASDDLPPFQEELDSVSVLVIDDLHLITDKAAAQEELACRIERRADAGKLTLLTCRRLPSDTRGLRPRLVSRALSGLTVSVVAPKLETRRVLLGELALLHGVALSNDLIEILNAGLPEDISVRELESAVKHMELWGRMKNQPVGLEAVQETLDTLHQKSELSISAITRCVARYFQLKSSDLRSSSRQQRIVRARSLAMTLSRRLTSQSLHQIGEQFGGRDHSTVLHAIRKTEALLDQDADLRRAAAEVTEKVAA